VRVAVISPFVDKQHGTERVLAEQLHRLSTSPGCEILLYSQQVRDLPVSPFEDSHGIRWRRVAGISGPYLLQYLFWLCANATCRWWDQRFRGVRRDLLFSPGINALDADAVAVHIVFHEFWRQAGDQLGFQEAPFGAWLRRLHRRLYYQLVMALERRVYRNPKVQLAAVSGLVARQLGEHFGRTDVTVIPNGVATDQFNSTERMCRRENARLNLGLDSADFALLLLGNDWVNKGLNCILRTLAILPDLPIKLIVAGSDDREIFGDKLRHLGLQHKVRFELPQSDVMLFYAAADVYVAPSLEDAYGLPIIEAMACGLPVVASIRAGASEAIQHRKNGLLLQDPTNENELARCLRELFDNKSLRVSLSEAAQASARDYNWERNAQELLQFLQSAVAHMRSPQDATG
jgi:glycosyltransferase involved in cell wall biosynthesis